MFKSKNIKFIRPIGLINKQVLTSLFILTACTSLSHASSIWDYEEKLTSYFSNFNLGNFFSYYPIEDEDAIKEQVAPFAAAVKAPSAPAKQKIKGIIPEVHNFKMTSETISDIQLYDYNYSIGTYSLTLKPLLDEIAENIKKNSKEALKLAPYYLKVWNGKSPHPFSDPSTKCWEVTVPPTSKYFTASLRSQDIATTLKAVQDAEIAYVKNPENVGNFTKDDEDVKVMIAKGETFKGRGFVRILIDDSCQNFCVSLYHDYKTGSDDRCNFAPAKTLTFGDARRAANLIGKNFSFKQFLGK